MAEVEKRSDRSPVPADWTYAPAPESTEIVSLRERYGLFVGGEEVEPRSGEWLTSISPSTEEPLFEAALAGAEDVELGADEVDMVIDRGAFLSGRYAKVYDEVVRVKEACGDAHLKVILEVAELGTYDNVRRASLLAMAAGADFIKTSTGKLPGAATLPVHLVMLEAIRDVHAETGRKVGMKPAGGIRTSKNAIQYLVQVHETLGPDWLTPDLYRIGASSLVNDILMQLRKEKTGAYQSKDYFTND